MGNHIHDDGDTADLQRGLDDAHANLKATLLAGGNTEMTRAEIKAFARRIRERVARVAVTEEERQEMRDKARRSRVARRTADIDQDIARRLARLNPPKKEIE